MPGRRARGPSTLCGVGRSVALPAASSSWLCQPVSGSRFGGGIFWLLWEVHGLDVLGSSVVAGTNWGPLFLNLQ